MNTQIIHFVGGVKRTIPNVIKVYENEMCHILTAEGIEWIINKNNVLAVEILPEKNRPTKVAPNNKIDRGAGNG